MENTTNLNMVKPAGTDHALISVINSNMDIIDGAVGALPSGSTLQGEIDSANTAIGTLNTQIANKANVKKDNITGNSSASITISVPCLVMVGRASASNSTTTAFIDGWSSPIYISNNAAFTLSVSGTSLTITNGTNVYASYMVVS